MASMDKFALRVKLDMPAGLGGAIVPGDEADLGLDWCANATVALAPLQEALRLGADLSDTFYKMGYAKQRVVDIGDLLCDRSGGRSLSEHSATTSTCAAAPGRSASRRAAAPGRLERPTQTGSRELPGWSIERFDEAGRHDGTSSGHLQCRRYRNKDGKHRPRSGCRGEAGEEGET